LGGITKGTSNTQEIKNSEFFSKRKGRIRRIDEEPMGRGRRRHGRKMEDKVSNSRSPPTSENHFRGRAERNLRGSSMTIGKIGN
jgi:hypothetical protein